MEKNLKKMLLASCLALVMLSSATVVTGQALWSLENTDIEVTLEVKGENCNILIVGRSSSDWQGVLLDGWSVENVDISNLEIMSTPGQAGVSVNLSGSITFDMLNTSQFAIHWLDYLVVRFQENSEDADSLMMWLVENKNLNQMLFPFAEIENIHVNSITWDQPILSGAFTLTLTGSGFDDPALAAELPFNGQLTARLSENFVDLAVENMKGKTSEVSFYVNIDVPSATRTLNMGVKLPSKSSEERWLKAPAWCRALSGTNPAPLETILKQNEITLTLKVPNGPVLSNLPAGYVQLDGNTYVWTGDSASEALSQLVTGAAGASIAYPSPLPIWIWAAIAVIVALTILSAAKLRTHM